MKSDGFKKYFTNTSWLFFDNVINLIIGFGMGILIARYLGASDFGLLSFAKSTAKLFSVFCALGLEKIIIKRFIDQKDEHDTIMGTGVGMKAFAAVFCVGLISLLGLLIFEDTLTYSLVVLFVAVTFFESFVIIRFFFQSRVESRFIARVVTYKIIISSGVKLLLLYFQAPLIYFAYEALLESVLGTVGYIYIYQRRSENLISTWKFSLPYAKNLLRDSWPLLISGFVVYVYMEIDILMIKSLMGNAAVGHYSIAVRLTNIWNMAGIVICSSLFPAILNAKNNDQQLYLSRFSSLLRLLVGISLSIALAVFIGGGWFIHTFFGEEYLAAISPLNILVWSVIFVNLGIASQQWHIAEGLQKLLLVRTTIGAVVNLILNFILIPTLGINGAAIATLVAQISATYLSNCLSTKTIGLFYMQSKSLIFLK